MNKNIAPAQILFMLALVGGIMLVYCLVFTHRENPEAIVQQANTEAPLKLEEAKNSPEFYEQLNNMLQDRTIGEIPIQRLLEAKRIAEQKSRQSAPFREITLNWEERGPDNIGGRTRSFLFDANDPSKQTVFVGSVSGGLWKTTNIDSPTPNWVSINDFFSALSISSIVQDPINTNIIYFASGESFGNGGRGLGVWKSFDGGNTFNQLESTNTSEFYYINRMVIDDVGHIYLARNIGGLVKSIDGGASWQRVLGGASSRATDVEIASDGRLYAVLNNDPFATPGIFTSTDKAASWTLKNSGLPNSFNSRVELTSAFSNPDFALVYLCQVSELYKTTDGGNNWTLITTPNIGSQCGWDITIGIHPTDENIILLGQVSLALSIDGGLNWKYASSIHVDHHVAYFDPDRPGYLVNTNDGGIYSGVLNESNNNFTLPNRNKGYRVTQFYKAAIHPDPASNILLGGTQDNGTQLFTGPGLNTTSFYSGGDGGYCVIDDNEPNIWISSFQNGVYQISNDAGNTRSTFNTGGGFIDPAIYDSQSNSLYSASSTSGTYSIIRDVGETNLVDTRAVPDALANFSTFSNSPTISNRIYLGTYGGQVFRVDNANAGQIISSSLVSNNMINGSISGISIEKGNEDHIVLTVSNYGTPHVWESINGGASWENVSGDLPDFPVWDGMFAPDNPDQFLLATELGVWTTENLNGANTIWEPSNNGLANVRIFQLRRRKADNSILAASFGRGLYTTDFYSGLIGATDLEMELSASTQSPEPNVPFDITLTLNNTGFIDATGIEVSAPLPNGFSYLNQDATQGTYDPNTGIWTVGEMTKAGSVSLTLTLQFSITELTIFLAQVSQMDQEDLDSEPGNNPGGLDNEDDEGSYVFNSEGSIVDLELGISSSSPGYFVAEKATLSFAVRNNSSFDAEGVTVQLPLNDGIVYASDDPNFDPLSKIYNFETVLGNENKIVNLEIVFTNQLSGTLDLFAQIATQVQNDIDSSPGNNSGSTPSEDDEASLSLIKNPGDPCNRDWILTLQEQVDNFPPCEILYGSLNIEGDKINSLAGLSNLKNIRKTLVIYNTTQLPNVQGLNNLEIIGETLALPKSTGLSSLSGFDKLKTIEGFWYMGDNEDLVRLEGLTKLSSVGTGFYFSSNDALINLDELSNLQTTASIEISSNDQLKNIDGLQNVQSTTGNVLILSNNTLQSVQGLSGLTTVGGYLVFANNSTLPDLDGLQNVTRVDLGIYIQANPSLISLNGLDNIQSIGANLGVNDNTSLVDCCALYDFLTSPAADTISIDFENNPSDCSSETEILETCIPGGDEIDLELSLIADVSNPPIYSYVNYTLTIENKGPQTATNVACVFPVPNGLAFDNQTVTQGNYFHWGSGNWAVGQLGPNQSASINLRLFTLSTEAISSYAQITNASEPDSDSSPNNNPGPIPVEDDEAAVTINGAPDCAITDLGLELVCDNLGSPEPEDDRFQVFLNPTGTNLATTYNVSGDITINNVPYGTQIKLGGLFLIGNGPLSIIISDVSGNCSFGPFTIKPPAPCSITGDLPDLALSDLQIVPSGKAGQIVPYTIDLINSGVVPALGDYTIGVVLSEDQSYDITDAFAGVINTGNTPVGSINDVLGSITVPNLPEGDYYLILKADETNNILESNEDNNSIITKFKVIIDETGCLEVDNLALGQATEQSSTLISNGITGSSEKAVDGNTSGIYFTENSSVAASQYSDHPWWQVDLGESTAIEKILVYNRTDGADKTRDFYVLVSDSPFGSASLEEARNQASFEQFFAGPAGTPSNSDVNSHGRYVRVQMQGSGHLTLAEVEVLGCEILNEGADLALSMSIDKQRYLIYENYVYTIKLENTGTEKATNVSVQVLQPEGMAFTSTQESQGEYFPWGEFLWTVGSIEAGASATLEVLWFTLVEDQTITAYAQVFSSAPDDPDSTPGNGTAPTVSEDDEAVAVLNPASISYRNNQTENPKFSVRDIRIHQVYPNPAREKVEIKLLSGIQENIRLELYDIKAQLMLSKEFELHKGPNTLQLNTSQLPSGLYHLMLFPKKGRAKMTKFLIQE